MRGSRGERGEPPFGHSGQVSVSPQEREGQEAAPAQATLTVRGDKGNWYGIPRALALKGLLEEQRGLKARNRTHGWRLGCLVMMSTAGASIWDFPPGARPPWRKGWFQVATGRYKVNLGHLVPETKELPKATGVLSEGPRGWYGGFPLTI